MSKIVKKRKKHIKSPIGKSPGRGKTKIHRPTYETALTYKNMGMYQAAADNLSNILAQSPNHSEAHHLLAQIYSETRHYQQAITHGEKAIACAPGNPSYHLTVANSYMSAGDFSTAIKYFQKAADLGVKTPGLFINIGSCRLNGREFRQALDSYRQALAVDPGNHLAHYGIGLALHYSGETAEAISHIRESLRSDPRNPEAFRLLVHLEDTPAAAAEAAAMEKLAANAQLPVKDRINILFGLGLYYEKNQQYDEAFRYFLDGNLAKRSTYEYQTASDESLFGRLTATYSADTISQLSLAVESTITPIFIVGMPRSGSSLIEQILSSHSRVCSLGEVNFLESATGILDRYDGYPEMIAAMTEEQLLKIRNRYLSLAGSTIKGECSYFTDKMLWNFRHVGLISILFPDAIVIHSTRDPVATCFSCFKFLFGEYLPQLYNLEELGRYYLLYAGIMKHWNAILPDFIINVNYEKLVADPPGRIKELVESCSLSWEDSCLEYYKNKRPTRTTSAAQVRRPIYKSGVDLWKNYAPQLAPLIKVLKDGGLLS